MLRTAPVFAALAALALPASPQVNARAVTQSHAPTSPIAHSSADVLTVNSVLPPDPFLWRAADLGLAAGMNVDSFSDGSDFFPSPGPASGGVINCRTVVVEYTVDPQSAGAPGSVVVRPQCTGNGCASDVFRATFTSPTAIGYSHVSDAMGITPIPVETDIDALAWRERTKYPVYFTLDPASAAAMGVSPADVLVQFTPGGVPVVLFSEALLGLVPGDDIDALAVQDTGPCSFPGLPFGQVVFSLSRTSPSRNVGGVTEAGLFEPDPAGGIRPWALDTQLELAGSDSDNLNGVRITDPHVVDVMDGTQPDPLTGFPHEVLAIDGSTGNTAHIVHVGLGDPFTYSATHLDPALEATLLFFWIGRPCDSLEFYFPPAASTLAFPPLKLLGPVGGPPSPIAVPPFSVPVDITLQGIVVGNLGAWIEKTNMITVSITCH